MLNDSRPRTSSYVVTALVPSDTFGYLALLPEVTNTVGTGVVMGRVEDRGGDASMCYMGHVRS
jgi:hypothetical protein